MANRRKRPADVNQRAVLIAKIATGEIEDTTDLKGKNPHAVALGKLGGKKGGKARAKSLSDKERSEIAKKAAKARWSAK